MASFRWNPEADLEGRYAGARDSMAAGVQAWMILVAELREYFAQYPPRDEEFHPAFPRAAPQDQDRLQRIFSAFLDKLPLPRLVYGWFSPPRRQRLFISHSRHDKDEAERIAELASNNGLEYWLDVHDPVLRFANRVIPPSHPVYPILIAAIIEMALLNCTHIVAAHTQKSKASQWIPYEFGRAKTSVYSLRAAGWFETGVPPLSRGEYVLLAQICPSETTLDKWLAGQGAPFPPIPYGHGPTSPLP